jgi:hypothetical protein
MGKFNWQWAVTIVSSLLFVFYLGYSNNVVLTMRGVSLGMPDPWYFVWLGLILLFSGWFMFVAIGQERSTEIATNVGGICVHSQDPNAMIKPLDCYLIAATERAKRERQLRDSWKYKDYISKDEIATICRVNNWTLDSPEFENFLTNYKRSINSFKPLGFYPDGGIRFFGMHGLRWWIGGTAILVVSPEYLIPHGDGLVCVAAVKTYQSFEQLDELPREVMAGVYRHFHHYVPGKHIIIWGDQPHPAAVRARVERNKNVENSELHKRPKYIWTLGLVEKPVDAEQREKYLGQIENALLKEVGEMRNSQAWWQEYEKQQKEKAMKDDGGEPVAPAD